MIDLLFINICSVHGVHPKTTHEIIKHESSFMQDAININRRKPSDSSLKVPDGADIEAKILFAESLYASNVNFDVGLMQVNSFNFKSFGVSVREAFDPCTNIRLGTEILKRFYARAERSVGSGQEALKYALSAYNTGNHHAGFENGYVSKFYGKRTIPKEDPYRVSMIPSENSEQPKSEKKLTSPYSISMIPTHEENGDLNDKSN